MDVYSARCFLSRHGSVCTPDSVSGKQFTGSLSGQHGSDPASRGNPPTSVAVILGRQLHDGINKGGDMIRVNARGDAVTQIENVTTAMAETGED